MKRSSYHKCIVFAIKPMHKWKQQKNETLSAKLLAQYPIFCNNLKI